MGCKRTRKLGTQVDQTAGQAVAESFGSGLAVTCDLRASYRSGQVVCVAGLHGRLDVLAAGRSRAEFEGSGATTGWSSGSVWKCPETRGSSAIARPTRVAALTVRQFDAPTGDFFEKSRIQGSGFASAADAHLAIVLLEQAQGDPP